MKIAKITFLMIQGKEWIYFDKLWCTLILEVYVLCQFLQSLHEVNVPVTAVWSQFHASLVRQWSCQLVWGMGPLSLPAECSLFTNLHNFGKKSPCTNTVEVLILDTFCLRLQLCRWILISYIIIKCNWLDWLGSPHSSHMDATDKGVWCWAF